jgi:hypothetical protein
VSDVGRMARWFCVGLRRACSKPSAVSASSLAIAGLPTLVAALRAHDAQFERTRAKVNATEKAA